MNRAFHQAPHGAAAPSATTRRNVMSKVARRGVGTIAVAAALICASAASPAVAQVYWKNDMAIFGSGSSSSYRSGDTIYGSNGDRWVISGDTVYGPNGRYTRSGDIIYGPDGQYVRSGDTIYGPNGQRWTGSGDTIYGSNAPSCIRSGTMFYCR
jgi:hypothetical protein